MSGTLALGDIAGLACTLCNECWLIDAGRPLAEAQDALALHMSRVHGTARFEIEVMTR